MNRVGFKPFGLLPFCPFSPLSPSGLLGHSHLAQGDAAVVGRRQGMGEHLEASFRQGTLKPGEQQGVLHDAAGQGHQVQPGALPDQGAGVGQEPDQGGWEAGGDGGGATPELRSLTTPRKTARVSKTRAPGAALTVAG